MRIECNKGITASHWQYLSGWREQVFPIEGKDKQWSKVEWHLMVYAKDALPIAHLGFDRFALLVGEGPIDVIGVGGVVVRPEYQGQGVPKLLFERLHRDAPERLGSSAFTLFCPGRLVVYYQKFGYRQHVGEVWFEQRESLVKSHFELMYHGLDLAAEKIVIPSAPW